MILFLLILGVVSLLLTGVVRRIALSKNLLDIPNHRSSHKIPTPRGGGIAIVVSVFIGMLGLYYTNNLSFNHLVAFFGAGLLIALAGFWDDKFSLSPIKRLVIQFIAAGWGLYWLEGFPSIQLGFLIIDNKWLLTLFAILYLVWLTNLYNFMDGINGIASLQAISVTLGMVLIFYWRSGEVDYFSLSVCFATCGFLYWNFPKARIFMGDVGSGFLGLILGLISVSYAHLSPLLFISFIIMMAVFILDATLTLLRRLFRKERVYEAHSSHAYQHAAQLYQSHTKISLTVVTINLVWLLPIALGVALQKIPLFLGLIIAYLPLIVLGIKLKAGTELSAQQNQ